MDRYADYDSRGQQVRANAAGAVVAGVVLLAAVLFGGGFARGADMTPALKAPPRAPTVSDPWSQFYIGAEVGYARSSFDFADIGKLDPKCVAFGGFAGRNWRAGAFVGGVEISGDWSGCSSHLAIDKEVTASAKVDMLGSVRARLGILPFGDNLLLYGTAGLGIGHSQGQLAIGDIAAIAPAVSFGWVGGAGAEFKLNSALSLRLQYLHYDLGKESYTFSSKLESVTAPAKLTNDSLMLGAVVHF